MVNQTVARVLAHPEGAEVTSKSAPRVHTNATPITVPSNRRVHPQHHPAARGNREKVRASYDFARSAFRVARSCLMLNTYSFVVSVIERSKQWTEVSG